jgi:hypothetical protein
MFVLRPSSPLGAPRPDEPAEAVAAPADQGPYIDEGLPVPDSYGVDILRALLQDPFRIFIYWEVREVSLVALTRFFTPAEARAFRVALKLTETGGRHEAFFEVARRGRYWMMVFPDREYEFEIGVRSPEHGFVSLLRSNRVRTPRGTVSPARPTLPEYRLEPREFARVLEASGFGAEQALSITIAAMPGTVAEDGAAGAAISRLPESIRAAIRLAGAGRPLTREVIEALPEPLRTEMLDLLVQSDGRIAAAGLMHYLPEILREAVEDDRELIGDRVHPLHIAPRFFVGASENARRPGEDLRWPAARPRPSSDARYRTQDAGSGAGTRRILSEI